MFQAGSGEMDEKKDSYKVKLYKLQSALANAVTSLEKASAILDSIIKEQMEK